MAKQSLSVTLEPKTIENIKIMAAEEMRTVSNMIDYIVAQYMITKEKSNSAKSARAVVFGEQMVVNDYAKTQSTLKKNIQVDEADVAFLNGK